MSETETQVTNNDAPKISELTENEHIKKFLNSKLFKYFSSDPATKIAVATAIITAGSFVVRLLDYMRWKGFLSVFSMDIRYADFSASHGFPEFLLHSTVFVGFAIATSLSYLVMESLCLARDIRKMTYSLQKTKLWLKVWWSIKDTVKKIPVMLCVFAVNSFLNFLLWTFSASAEIITYSGWLDWCIVLVTSAVLELIAAIILLIANKAKIKREIKEKKKNDAKSDQEKHIDEISKSLKIKRPLLVDIALSSVLLYIFLLCTSAYFAGTREARQADRFSFTEDQYAIIYQDDDCYWTVLSSEDGGVLRLDTTQQKVIEIVGTEIEYRDYKDVVINYD